MPSPFGARADQDVRPILIPPYSPLEKKYNINPLTLREAETGLTICEILYFKKYFLENI